VSTTQDLQGQGGRASFITGDVFDVLAAIDDGSVDWEITSPPYWALRSYIEGDDREIGAEDTPAEYLATMLRLTDELHRTLSDRGVLWLNLGDSAAFSGGSGGDYNEGGLKQGQAKYEGTAAKGRTVQWARESPGMPLAKSRCWLPELLGASMAYGWNLLTGEPCAQWITRRHVIWCKPSPTPGELIDAPRDATESVILAVKSSQYAYNLDATRSPRADNNRKVTSGAYNGHPKVTHTTTRPDCVSHPLGAPPLSWWEVSSAGYKGSHYAVMPDEIVTRCLAPAPSRYCGSCDLPMEPVVRCSTCGAEGGNTYRRTFRKACTCEDKADRVWTLTGETEPCPCGGDPGDTRASVVLDPFGGSGTTLAVATGRGHHAIGIDLDPRNVDLARDRVGPMFLDEFTLDQWKNRSEVPS